MIDTYLQADADMRALYSACNKAGLKPIYHPFWESLPHVNIFLSITPDILHQMLQGMVKHLIEWLVGIFRPAAINARSCTMPPNHKIKVFTNGITKLSRVSGQEHKRMSCTLLGLIIDLLVPDGQDPSCIVRAVRAVMDFLFVAQYQCQTSDTIQQLKDSLSVFHENKEVFLNLGVWENFNLPKLHSLSYYASSIRLFGTTDNYNTEQFKHLHIDFAKNAYRASNRKDKYYQMTKWLEHREKVQLHAALIDWRKQEHHQSSTPRNPMGPPHMCYLTTTIPQYPSRQVSFDDLAIDYGAFQFQDALGDFIAQVNNPGAAPSTLYNLSCNTLIPFSHVPVYHYFKFTNHSDSGKLEIVDSVHVWPELRDSDGRIIPPRFNIVVVQSTEPKGIVIQTY